MPVADVVVVGAGVAGASIAFQLASRKAGRVLVLERDQAGHGNSGQSSALVRMHYSFPGEVELALRSLELFRSWEDVVGRPGHLTVTGFVNLVGPRHVEALRANVAMQRALGADTRLISLEELGEMEPDWVLDDVGGAAFEPGSGYGDGSSTAGDFLAAARERGASYRAGVRVTSLRVEAGRVRGVATSAGPVESPVVVLACGAWSRPLLADAGCDLPIETELHRVALLQNPPALRGRGLACIDHAIARYYRRESGDLTLVGDFFGERGVAPDAFRAASTAPELLAGLIEPLVRRVPKLADAGIFRGVAGVYDMTPDERPLLGPVPGLEGLFVAAGFSGMGYKISPAVGMVLAEQILDGRATSVDARPFRPERFAEGDPIRAAHEYD